MSLAFEWLWGMQWKNRAIDLLLGLDFVRQGRIEPTVFFGKRDFVEAFKKVVEQYLRDLGYSEPEQELENCLLIRRVTFTTIHGHEPAFTSQASEVEWIAEALALHTSNLEIAKSELVRTIIHLSRHLEDGLIKAHHLPSESEPSVYELIEKFEVTGCL